ncbi:MAG: SpoIIIAH-like family protein [Clostridia bacterium]|nr:SpoIIIAH-like family protein [Clostridia bacterium]
MKWENVRKVLSEAVRKVKVRTIATVCTVVILGGMVILNMVLYGKDTDTVTGKLAVDLASDAPMKTAGQTELTADSLQDYFQTMSLNRRQTRDEAREVLLSVAESPAALDDVKEAAMADINKLAADMEKETNIETMILAKGFTQCIAVISEDNCSVIVESDGLDPGEVAQITEIVYEQAGIHPTRLKIVEKNLTEA